MVMALHSCMLLLLLLLRMAPVKLPHLVLLQLVTTELLLLVQALHVLQQCAPECITT